MSTTVILYLPTHSASLSYCLFEEVLARSPLLAWWTQQVNAMPSVKDVVVLVRSDGASTKVRRLLDASGARLHTCNHHNFTRSLATFVAECGEPRIAMVRLTMPFGPHGLLAHAYAHHTKTGNEVTEVIGLPRGLAPVIFEAHVLNVLASIRVPGAPTDPLQTYRCVQAVGTQAAADVGLTGVSIPFDGDAVYQREGALLPFAIGINGREDVETCRRVLTRVGDARRDDTVALEAWREEQRRDRLEQSRSLAREACIAAPVCDQRPRVLYVSNPSATTGAERSLVQMISGISQQRFGLFALVAEEGLFVKELASRGVHVICPGVDFDHGSADDHFLFSEIIRQLDPSIVHLNALSGSAVLAASAERAIPIICHTRNRPGPQYSDAFSYSSAVIAVSRYIKSEIMQFGVPENQIHVIHNGIDTQEFRRQQFDRAYTRARLGIDIKAKVILMVARLTPYKRHDIMIAALPLIRAVLPTARVIAIGEAFGEEEFVQALKDKIDEQGQHDFFTFLPFQEDVRPLYVAADALVLCSDGEPLARTVIEALALETPIVATDSGGTLELIRHNETALIARSGSAESVAERLIETLTDISGCAARTRAGRAFVEAHLSTRVAAERMMEVYDSVLHAQRHGTELARGRKLSELELQVDRRGEYGT